MPVVEAHLIEGNESEAKSRLAIALTGAVRQVLPAALDGITVMIHELKADAYMRGGQHKTPAAALPDPVQMVKDFLSAMEARDLDQARTFLAPDFVMYFPAQAPMHRLEELVEWSKPRYRFVRKTYEAFDVTSGATGPTVYVFGTLHGEWLDGTIFSGIRFVDRFETAGGLFTRQDVWNDMAETKASA
ncbi:nuclear transport factor 2 family protein [Sulfitobacter sp. D35]|uniref:nuclear transport factor 2 family protein n=1 Tax=Sulfitobacter sp. D35 TaxID=3083252 RepID=UPI00296E673D|nr:nuclear transport factor 2 family protein [Sulfitobacter sp. D35]MDW4499189.1 nuclear transport factor 2 family protein [Sulfitobacter sp. D35]